MKDNNKLLNWLRSCYCYDNCPTHTNLESSMLCAILSIIENPKNSHPYLIFEYKVLREFLDKLYLNKHDKVLYDLFYFDAVVGRLNKYYYIYEAEDLNKRKDKNMGKEDVLVNCWRRIWNKVDSDDSFMHPDVPKKFDFIMDIIKGNKVDTSKYTHLELIGFIDNITRCVDIAKGDYPLITRIVICVNECYEDVDAINITEDRPNTPKEAQKELLKVLRSILDSSDSIREYAFGTSKYYDILKLDPDEIITKYNNYIKSTDYKIGDEICMTNDPNMRAWITKIERYDFECLLDDGSVRCFPKIDVKKTGRNNLSLGAILAHDMEGCIITTEEN